MFVEYIKDSENQGGYPIKKGTRTHLLNETANQLIKSGIVEKVEDPENYAAFPVETNRENGTEENETDIISNKPSSKQKKRPKKR